MFQHKTVLLNPTVDALQVHDGGVYIDATFGRGGHTRYLLSQGHHLTVIAFDRDQEAILAGQTLQRTTNEKTDNHLELVMANFAALKEQLATLGITAVDGILYDLGVSSPQFDDPQRGFSYRYDARLDMRMDQSQALDAYQIVNTYSSAQLANIFQRYGDERFAKRIAQAIVQQRLNQPIATTFELVNLIEACLPAPARRKMKKHPAKKVFQALRIAVNDELSSLDQSLEAAVDLLKLNGFLSVITFQSLEDKIVKQVFRRHSEVNVPRDLPIIPPEMQPELKVITRKPILPSSTEIEQNHRAHSAHLRVAQKIK